MKITLALEEEAHGETPPSPQGNIDFSFLPKALVEKCKPFIIRYHELNGFSSLPDILWHPETHQFMEADLTLKRLFKTSTSSRGAKKQMKAWSLLLRSFCPRKSSQLGSPAGQRA